MLSYLQILMNVKTETLGWNVKKSALNALISQDPTSAAVNEAISLATNTVKVTYLYPDLF